MKQHPSPRLAVRPTAEILSQGDEVVSGQTVDSNAAWLAQRLTELGFALRGHTTVGDRLIDIRDAVSVACERCDLVICSGGLGPTDDDLTAAAVAAAADVALQFDAEAMQQIERMFQRFGKPMPDSNRKQALLPAGCLRLDNRWGTAPGFACELSGAWLACVPGVPREMRKLFAAHIEPALQQRFELQPGRLVTLRVAGVGESRLQQLIGHWDHPQAVLSYRTMPPENQVKLRFAPGFDAEAARGLVDELERRIGAGVFARQQGGDSGGDLAAVTLGLMQQRGLSLAVTEHGSGGSLTAMLYRVAGADRTLIGARVAGFAGPDSGPAAELAQLAQRSRVEQGADLGLALRLDSDANAHHPGSVELALTGPAGVARRSVRVAGGRELMRTLAAGAAIDLLRRQLLNPDDPGPLPARSVPG